MVRWYERLTENKIKVKGSTTATHNVLEPVKVVFELSTEPLVCFCVGLAIIVLHLSLDGS